jgi:hypothetical protein
MRNQILTTFAVAVLLAGCASGVTRNNPAAANRAGISANNQVSSVTLTMTEDAKKKQIDNLKFNSDELLGTIRRALDSSKFINASEDAPRPSLEIQVTDMRVRSTFTAVALGFMAGADSINADVILRDKGGTELDRFAVSASYALGGLAGGQDSSRMSWLYEKFAEVTVKELTRELAKQ